MAIRHASVQLVQCVASTARLKIEGLKGEVGVGKEKIVRIVIQFFAFKIPNKEKVSDQVNNNEDGLIKKLENNADSNDWVDVEQRLIIDGQFV